MTTHDPDFDLPADRLPKLCGADVEVGNFLLGVHRPGGTGPEASRALLREISGLPRGGRAASLSVCSCSACRARRGAEARHEEDGGAPKQAPAYSYNAQDWGRKFLPDNGGCVYIDLDHLELAAPETLSAYDHLACWHAMLQIARPALRAANARLPAGQRLQVLINNSDGLGHSYGSHLNFLVTRRCWENIFHRKMHHLLYLAAYQASSLVFTGQGKVGAENGAPEVAYQISQRADFCETLTGVQTTYRRPLVNSRDEPLCGEGPYRSWDERSLDGKARLHVIFYDSNLCHAAHLLKVGVLQIVLAMIEAERVNPSLILDDPIDSAIRWSHDPSLQMRARMASGRRYTAAEVQLQFLEEARRFLDAGGCEGIVPRAEDLFALWADTLRKLHAGDLDALAGRLDWVLKRQLLERAVRQRSELSWESPQLKHLDHLYSSLDPAEGLYWACERDGLTERLVSPQEVEHFVQEPPADTRAWTRAQLLRQAEPDDVDDVDWDRVRVKRRRADWWSAYRTVYLDDPLAGTRAAAAPLFEAADTLDDVLDALAERRRLEPTPAAASDGPATQTYPLVPVEKEEPSHETP